MSLPPKEEISRIINLAYDSVESSKLGAIIYTPDANDISNKAVNQLALTVFYGLCNILVSKSLTETKTQ